MNSRYETPTVSVDVDICDHDNDDDDDNADGDDDGDDDDDDDNAVVVVVAVAVAVVVVVVAVVVVVVVFVSVGGVVVVAVAAAALVTPKLLPHFYFLYFDSTHTAKSHMMGTPPSNQPGSIDISIFPNILTKKCLIHPLVTLSLTFDSDILDVTTRIITFSVGNPYKSSVGG